MSTGTFQFQMARWLDGDTEISSSYTNSILQRQRRRVSIGTTGCDTCAGKNKCINKGICQEENSRDGYICLCPPGYSGKKCEKVGMHEMFSNIYGENYKFFCCKCLIQYTKFITGWGCLLSGDLRSEWRSMYQYSFRIRVFMPLWPIRRTL